MKKENNDEKIALDWINTIESDKNRIRETDIYPKLNEWVSQVAPKAVLEIGCGQGVCSKHIDPERLSYVGIDPSDILIHRATELYSDNNRRFIRGSAYAIPFPDEDFDAVYSISVWHLIEDLQQAARELSRILQSQGSFLIISANPAAYSSWTGLYINSKAVGKRLEGEMKLQDGSTIHEVLYLHTLDELTESLEATGLKVLNVETFRMAQFVLISGTK